LTKHTSATKRDIKHRKETCQSTKTSLHAPETWWTLSRNGWERLASFCQLPVPLKFWEILPALPHGRCRQANVGTCYVVIPAYNLEQLNANRAHAGLCHASSLICCGYVVDLLTAYMLLYNKSTTNRTRGVW